MRMLFRSMSSFAMVLAVSGVVGACRPAPLTESPPEISPTTPATAKLPLDSDHLANCKALQDSAKQVGGGPVYITNEVDTEVELKKSDDFPRFDDLTLGPGFVKAFYLVSASGRAEPAFIRITQATRPGLETSVRRFLARAEYKPATIGGAPVRACVVQEFYFQRG